MAWRDDLVEAQLDDATFLYRSVVDEGGRRTVPFQYPGRDDPYIEDMGKEAGTWQVEAYLLGDNYHVDLQALREVLDTPGVRTLTHPYGGEFPVKLVGKYRITQSPDEGGMARVSFTLMEAGLSFPLIALDTGSKVGIFVPTALATLEAKTKFSLLGAIKDIIGAVLGALGKALSAINKVNGKINAALSTIQSASALIDGIQDGLNDLINAPGNLMNALSGLLDDIVGLITDFIPPTIEVDVEEPVFPQAELLMEVFADLFVFEEEASVVKTNTPQAAIEEEAIAAVNLHMKAATLATVSGGIVEVPLDSAGQAAAISETLAGAYDQILATEDLDEEVYEIFAALKGAVVQHLAVVQQSLPQLTTYTPNQTMPALVAAYELYEDARRESDIVRRNNIPHPCFLPGGRALEVTSE